jgi:hypothetical protein
MRYNKIYAPTGSKTVMKNFRGRMVGSGGSVLLNKGGAGAGSTYDGIDDYLATTEKKSITGSGASMNLQKKLEGLSLSARPGKKIKNIKFNL